MFFIFSNKPKQSLRLLFICLSLFVLNSSNLTMQTLHTLYGNGNYQFSDLILQKAALADSAYIDIESLRYLSSKNNVKAMGLLADHYQIQQKHLLAKKLYYKILTLAEDTASKKSARENLFAFYENQEKWSQISGLLASQDDDSWHYLSQLHNSQSLSIKPSTALYQRINHDSLYVNRDFVTQENQLNITNCKINIAPIARSYHGLARSIEIIKTFNNDTYLSSLPVCFTKPLYIPKAKLKCTEQQGKAIACDLSHLAQSKNWPKGIRHLMIMSDKGKANVNSGVMYLAINSDFNVFKHEFMHLFGFEDEYQLSKSMQKQRCNFQALNLKHSQLTLTLNKAPELFNLHAVATCNSSELTAYKPVAELTLMQYLDKALPLDYKNRLEHNIENSLSDFAVFPMAFAKFNSLSYWYQYAAKLGFKGASLQLALYHESKGEVDLAITNLQQADDWPLAQSHLARLYYEKSDYKKARALYLSASKLSSDSFAQYFYGKMLNDGLGGKVDKNTAMHFFNLSAAQNNPLAVQYLNRTGTL